MGTVTRRAAPAVSAPSTRIAPSSSAARKVEERTSWAMSLGSRSRTTRRIEENAEMAITSSIRGSSAAPWMATAPPSETPITTTRSAPRKSITRERSRRSQYPNVEYAPPEVPWARLS